MNPMRLLFPNPGTVRSLRHTLARSAVDLRSLAGTARYHRFIIVGIARTGSTMLLDLLNGHSRIQAFGELFRQPDAIGWDVHPYRDYQIERVLRLYRSDPCRFLETKVWGRWPRGQGAVGFKIFYYHAREAPFAAIWDHLVRQEALRVIHIKRRNILAQYLSLQVAHKTNVWSSTQRDTRAPAPIRLGAEECRKHFEWVRALEAEIDGFFAGHRMLQVSYEELLADRKGEMTRIQRFLDVPEEEVRAKTVRQRTVPLREAIVNYDELAAYFRGSEWADFFAEATE
jgi:LPS sulfotransferase NodH